jgi:hypothetical protein
VFGERRRRRRRSLLPLSIFGSLVPYVRRRLAGQTVEAEY